MIQAKPRRPYLAMSESFQCHALGSLASEPRRLRLRVTSQPEAPSHVSEVGPGGGFQLATASDWNPVTSHGRSGITDDTLADLVMTVTGEDCDPASELTGGRIPWAMKTNSVEIFRAGPGIVTSRRGPRGQGREAQPGS